MNVTLIQPLGTRDSYHYQTKLDADSESPLADADIVDIFSQAKALGQTAAAEDNSSSLGDDYKDLDPRAGSVLTKFTVEEPLPGKQTNADGVEATQTNGLDTQHKPFDVACHTTLPGAPNNPKKLTTLVFQTSNNVFQGKVVLDADLVPLSMHYETRLITGAHEVMNLTRDQKTGLIDYSESIVKA